MNPLNPLKTMTEQLTNNQPVADAMHYRQIPATFNGQVFYYTLDEKFISCYRYKSGKIAETISELPNRVQLQVVSSKKKAKSEDRGVVKINAVNGKVDDAYQSIIYCEEDIVGYDTLFCPYVAVRMIMVA